MTISSTPCSCDGLNENCFRCWGTGMVEPKTLPVTGPKGDCFPPRTRRVFYPVEIFELPRAPAKTQTPLVQCPHCGIGVNSKQLEKHLLKVHRHIHSLRTTIQVSMNATRDASSARYKCDKCPAIFPNAIQLASHVIGSHGKRVYKKLGQQVSSGMSNALAGTETRELTERPTNLDAQRHWGSVARDHGQFGSHPSHDDMGDESFS